MACLTGASALAFARGDARFLRLGYWTLLAGRGSRIHRDAHRRPLALLEGPWEDLPGGSDEPTWLGIGCIVADLGALLVLVALILGGIGVRRLRNGKGTGLLKACMAISWLVLAAALVAVWAMAGKPD